MPSFDRSTAPVKRVDHQQVSAGGTMTHAEIERRLLSVSSTGGSSTGARYDVIVTGPLFLGTQVVPSYLIPADQVPTKIYARVQTNPTLTASVVVVVKYNATTIATLTITPTAVNGFSNTVTTGLPGFVKGKFLDFDITGIGETTPGNDLTVYIEV